MDPRNNSLTFVQGKLRIIVQKTRIGKLMNKSSAKWKAQPLAKTSHESAFGAVLWRRKTEIRVILWTQRLTFPKYCCQSFEPKADREPSWPDLMDWTIMRGSSKSSVSSTKSFDCCKPTQLSGQLWLAYFPRYWTEAPFVPCKWTQTLHLPFSTSSSSSERWAQQTFGKQKKTQMSQRF